MAGAAKLPTLPEVRTFNGDYLVEAATHWSNSANRWTDAFDGLNRDVGRPAGALWSGEAAEAAALRVGADRKRVTSAADGLDAAARVARRAAEQLHTAKTAVLTTVRAAEAAGFEVGEDFSLSTVESTTSATELAVREAQMRRFGLAIRSDVLALVRTDEDAAAEIYTAAANLRSLRFGERARNSAVVQAVDFHGVPVPEKPYLAPVPPSGGWSKDPLMRAAQKIAYGHAWTEHRSEFPDIVTKAQFADFIYQKLQRATTDPTGLRLGRAKDGAPVIYDPEDNTLIVRDIRPGTTQAGSAYKPDSPNPDYVAGKAPYDVKIFKQDDLIDGAEASSPSPQAKQANAAAPTVSSENHVGNLNSGGTLPDWGTHVAPDEAAKIDGALGILGRILLGQSPSDPRNPDGWS